MVNFQTLQLFFIPDIPALAGWLFLINDGMTLDRIWFYVCTQFVAELRNTGKISSPLRSAMIALKLSMESVLCDA